MTFNTDRSTKQSRIRRLNAGEYLKDLRKAQGLTQRELANILNLEYYTFVSQMECGQGRLPPHLYVKTAIALKVDIKDFALKMLSFYDPFTHLAITAGKEYIESTT